MTNQQYISSCTVGGRGWISVQGVSVRGGGLSVGVEAAYRSHQMHDGIGHMVQPRPQQTPHPGQTPPPSVTCERYSSYWNAFLYLMSLTDKKCYHLQSISRLVLSAGETMKNST